MMSLCRAVWIMLSFCGIPVVLAVKCETATRLADLEQLIHDQKQTIDDQRRIIEDQGRRITNLTTGMDT